MLKTLKYGIYALKIYYDANGVYAVYDIVDSLYSKTFYPLIQVYLLSIILDLLSSGVQLTFSNLSWIIGVWIIASILKVIISTIALIPGASYEFATNDYIELEVDKKLNELDPAVFESVEFQNLLAQMDGVKASMLSYVARTKNLLSSLVLLITAIIVVSTKFPIFIPIIILATIPLFLSYNKYRDDTWEYMSHERGVLTRLFQHIRQTLSNPATSKELAIFKNGPSLIGKFKSKHHTYHKKLMKQNKKSLFFITFSGFIQFGAFAITQALNLAAVFAGKLTIGQFTLYFQQTYNLVKGAEGTLDNYSSMNMRSKFIDNYYKFLNYPNFIELPKNPDSLPKKSKAPLIEFKNVYFKYPETEKYVLKDFNLVINKGEKIAFVGENGAGKTTLIKLILRFYDTSKGEIIINGINIKKLSLDEWYENIGVLFQDYIRYQFTFRENVVFGDLSKKNNLKALDDALRKSGAINMLQSMPKGVEQVVGKTFEDGIDLSGGQWQKLALARAFFRDSSILVLDEPTSAIDAKAEYEIFENVQKLQKDKTVIIISHRFSTVRKADRILVFDEGKIIEEGNHAKLMNDKGIYSKLFNLQASGYK